jgi:hypothetical protein
MTGIGKPPPPTTTKNVGVREKDARSRIYRNIGTRRNAWGQSKQSSITYRALFSALPFVPLGISPTFNPTGGRQPEGCLSIEPQSIAAKVTRRLIKKALFLLVGISPPVCCGRPESFSHFFQNLLRRASAIQIWPSICAIDNAFNPPVNIPSLEQHYIAAMPPLPSLAVRRYRFLQELKVALGAAPTRALVEQVALAYDVFVRAIVVAGHHRLAPAKPVDLLFESFSCGFRYSCRHCLDDA